MRRAEVENALRQEDRLRVNTPNGPGWVHGPLDDSGSVRVGFDDGTSGRCRSATLNGPGNRGPRTATVARGPRRCRIWAVPSCGMVVTALRKFPCQSISWIGMTKNNDVRARGAALWGTK